MKTTFNRSRVVLLLPVLILLATSLLVVSTVATCETEKNGWLGVSLQELTADLREAMDITSGTGVLITNVVEESPAQEAGIAVGDVILKYNDTAITSPHHLSRLVRKTAPGSKVTVEISRQGKEKSLTVKIGDLEREMETYSWHGEIDLDEIPHLIGHWLGPDLWLGVHTVDLSDQLAQYFHIKDGRGVLIKEVIEDSPAEKAGLKAGDVIIKADGERIEDTPALHQIIGGHEEGEDMGLVVVRGGKEKKLTATLEEPPFHGADKLAKKLKKLPGKLERMMMKAPCHERMKVKVPLHELKDIRVEVIKELDELDIQELEDRLDKLEEELDLIKEKIETD